MSKAIKFKNNTYLDSSGIVHDKETLPNFIVGKVISFDKNIHIFYTKLHLPSILV